MSKLLFSLFLLGGCACADGKPPEAGNGGGPPAGAAAKSGPAPERFACEAPPGWEVTRGREREKKTGIVRVDMAGPRVNNAPVLISAVFYGEGNASFADHRDFIERNSRNVLGETKSETEKFSPVKETLLSGKKAFEFGSEIKEYLHPEGGSAAAVVIREKIYVIPAPGGFFVLRYSAPASAYAKYLPAFKRTVASFRIR